MDLTLLPDKNHWQVAMVGDPMQFSAIGRGGMFQHLLDTHSAIELDTVRRNAARLLAALGEFYGIRL